MVLVPFKESLPLTPEHEYRFDDCSFPEKLNGFRLTKLTKIFAPCELWFGWQLLAVYEPVTSHANFIENYAIKKSDGSGLVEQKSVDEILLEQARLVAILKKEKNFLQAKLNNLRLFLPIRIAINLQGLLKSPLPK